MILPRRRLLRLVLACVLWVLGTAAVAQDAVVEVVVDRNEATIEDRIRLDVVVRGNPDSRPVFPDLPGFEVIPAGNSQSTQVINGRMSSSISFQYVLVPRELGEFTVGPIEVSVDRALQSTKPIRLRVVAADQAATSRDYFLTATVSDRSPFVGEQVLYTWRFYRRVDVANARLVTLEFGDLVSEDLGDVREYETTQNGVQYVVSEIRKALFPQRPGQAVIPPSEMSCQVAAQTRRRRRSVFDDFFDRREMVPKTLRTAPIELDVRALPDPPAGFSGLVGDFDVTSSMSKTELKVGESATLALTLSGTGNAQMLSEPQLPDLSAFKVYDDKPSAALDRSGDRLSGRKTYRKALVPLQPGAQGIPGIELVYFDPSAEVYRTRATADIEVVVSPSDGEEELMLTQGAVSPGGKVAVRILSDDVLPLHKDLSAVTNRGIGGWKGAAFAASALAPPALYLALLAGFRHRRRLATDGGYRRQRLALRTARDELQKMAGDDECKYDSGVLTRRASRCLRTFVGDKLGVEGGALTLREVSELLEEAGVESGMTRRVHDALERFEAAQYASSEAPTLGFERDKVVASVTNLVRDLDQEMGA